MGSHHETSRFVPLAAFAKSAAAQAPPADREPPALSLVAPAAPLPALLPAPAALDRETATLVRSLAIEGACGVIRAGRLSEAQRERLQRWRDDVAPALAVVATPRRVAVELLGLLADMLAPNEPDKDVAKAAFRRDVGLLAATGRQQWMLEAAVRRFLLHRVERGKDRARFRPTVGEIDAEAERVAEPLHQQLAEVERVLRARIESPPPRIDADRRRESVTKARHAAAAMDLSRATSEAQASERKLIRDVERQARVRALMAEAVARTAAAMAAAGE